MQTIKITDYILTDILEAERISLEEIYYEDPKEIEARLRKQELIYIMVKKLINQNLMVV